MSERGVDEKFSQILGDMQYAEYNEALGVCQEYAPMNGQAQRLQAIVDEMLVKCGGYNKHSDEEKAALRLSLDAPIVEELCRDGQFEQGDLIIANGDAFVLLADDDIKRVEVAPLGGPRRLHGFVKHVGVMQVPVFTKGDRYLDPDYEFLQLSVVLHIDQSELELVGDTSTGDGVHFHELDDPHVILPLVYTRDGLQIKRRLDES